MRTARQAGFDFESHLKWYLVRIPSWGHVPGEGLCVLAESAEHASKLAALEHGTETAEATVELDER